MPSGPETLKEGDRSPSRIAYLLSQYPAVSHTFFLTEILMMRQRGFLIETASVNAIQPPADGFPPAETVEAQNTFYIKKTPKLEILRVLAKTIFTRPGVIFRGSVAALRLTPWDPRGTALAFFYLLEAILVGDWMRRKGCTHLHVHFSGPVASVAMLASIAWQIPYSLTVHGPDEFFDLSRFFLKKKITRAKFVTCISFFARSQLLRISAPEIWPKFHVCRLGVQTGTFAPVARGPSGHLHIMSVGRLHPSKGQIFLLRAFSELLRRGHAVRLNIVGGGGEFESLQRFVTESGMSDAVTLHGPLSHAATRRLLGTADLFVLSSFAEGVPVALMEAMAMEVACVSTFVGGTAELIEHGKEGLLVPPSSEEALVGAMESLICDGERRVAMAREGRRKVLAKYDISTNIDGLVEVFEQYGLVRAGKEESGAPVVRVRGGQSNVKIERPGSASTPDISILIVSFNTREVLRECLQSVEAFGSDLHVETIVVDNCSADGSMAMVREAFPRAIVIESERNLGFGGANNLGFEAATGKYVVLLNSDAFLGPETLRVSLRRWRPTPRWAWLVEGWLGGTVHCSPRRGCSLVFFASCLLCPGCRTAFRGRVFSASRTGPGRTRCSPRKWTGCPARIRSSVRTCCAGLDFSILASSCITRKWTSVSASSKRVPG